MKNQRKIDLIVVHCSATRINQDFPVEALEACHKARGFYPLHRLPLLHYEGSRDLLHVVQKARRVLTPATTTPIASESFEGGLDEKGKPADTGTSSPGRASLEDLLYSLVLDYPDAEIGHRDLPWFARAVLASMSGMAEGNQLPYSRKPKQIPEIRTIRVIRVQNHPSL